MPNLTRRIMLPCGLAVDISCHEQPADHSHNPYNAEPDCQQLAHRDEQLDGQPRCGRRRRRGRREMRDAFVLGHRSVRSPLCASVL
jgi:hypothetical protein